MGLVALGEPATVITIFGHNGTINFNGMLGIIGDTASGRQGLNLGLDQRRQLEENFLGESSGRSSFIEVAVGVSVVATTNGASDTSVAIAIATTTSIAIPILVASGGRCIAVLSKFGFNVVNLALKRLEGRAGCWLFAGTMGSGVLQSHVGGKETLQCGMRGQLQFGIHNADISISLEQGVHDFVAEIRISAESEPFDGRAAQGGFLILESQIELDFIHNQSGFCNKQTDILSRELADVQGFKFGNQHADSVDGRPVGEHGDLMLHNGVVKLAVSGLAKFADHELKLVCA